MKKIKKISKLKPLFLIINSDGKFLSFEPTQLSLVSNANLASSYRDIPSVIWALKYYSYLFDENQKFQIVKFSQTFILEQKGIINYKFNLKKFKIKELSEKITRYQKKVDEDNAEIAKFGKQLRELNSK